MKKIMLAIAIAGMSSSALANNFNYNYFEVRTAISPESMGAEYSTFFTENSHLVVRLDSQFEGDFDLAGGIGFNGPVTPFVDIYGQLLIHQIKYTDDYGGDNDTLPEVNFGARVWLTDQLEATGRIGRLDDSSVVHAGIRFHSNQQFSMSAESRNNGIYGPQVTMSVRFQY